MLEARTVAVTIVTYNSAHFIRQCLEYALAQDYRPCEVIVVDNASGDETPPILRAFEDRVKVVYNSGNTGFAAGQNQAIALTDAAWVLTLNPDVRLTPSFIGRLVEAGEADPAAGSVCGKLLAIPPDFAPLPNAVFDSTGIYFTPNLRHFDRGSKIPDHGQYDQPEYVFGATGAACLYRRSMIEDISIENEFFDAAFFAYREDADLAWRAQLLGWKCRYTPCALAYHVRSVLPANRAQVSSVINMHSVKNRWLMRIKNITADLYRRHWLAITWRDCLVIAGCIFHELSSLQAFVLIYRALPATLRKRRAIMQKRRASDAYLAAWFSDNPVSFPAAAMSAKASGEKLASR